MKPFDKVDLTVTFKNIPVEDAITLQTMFNLYESDGRRGHSEWIGYFVDGDGSFRPKVSFKTSKPLPSIIAHPVGKELHFTSKSNFFDPDTVYDEIIKVSGDAK